MAKYNFKKIEKKWQKAWEKKKIFQVKVNSKKKKFYCLEMFPYPSGSGLHMGHALNYSIGDVYSRYKRMSGFNVLYPMGFDSFGLPAENAAIKAKEHPKKYTEKSVKNFIKQMKEIGLSYDWNRTIKTSNQDYYKWNQLFFLKFLEKGLVYRKKASVNFCKKCNTVLANEQVHNGMCWRHIDTEVDIKQLEQWFIKTTKYAEELLEKVWGLDWPNRIKIMQKNWIGKSHGTEVLFEIEGEKWPIFTKRVDTIYGVTFMVISAQHPRLMELVTKEQKKNIEKFLKKVRSTSEKDIEDLEKEGVFTGSYAINPINNEKIPVYTGNFVLADYGSGMVMAVPAHDQRDFEFARKYNIPIKEVVMPTYEGDCVKEWKSQNKVVNDKNILNKIRKSVKSFDSAYTGQGTLVNSGAFNGLSSREAIEHITKALESKKLGKKTISYKLRDWLVSRQRYWGTPIPIIYCAKCGAVPVKEKDLPVKLPEKVKFGKGNPLTTNKKFLEAKCPKCNGKAKRETDTMDTFFDSSWYFLRFVDPKNSKKPFEVKKENYWMPVNQYIGGAEHACMHLIYARFFTKALSDLGFFGNKKVDEPFIRLFNQGMLHGKDGYVMAKSRGNVVLPEEVSNKYGIDTARLFLMSVASPDKDVNWSEKGIDGSLKFMNKTINYFNEVKIGKTDSKVESKLNKTIKEVTKGIESFRYNIAIIKIRDLFNSLPETVSKKTLEDSLKLLHPFCPHITEELWDKIKGKGMISLASWPKADEKKIDVKLEEQEEAVEKLSGDINHVVKIVKDKGKKPKKVFVYVLPKEKDGIIGDLSLIKKKTGLDITVFSVNDFDKYDPKNKSKKVKPGRPGIYLE